MNHIKNPLYYDHEGQYQYVNIYFSRTDRNYQEANNANVAVTFNNNIVDEPWKYEMAVANITCNLATIPLLKYEADGQSGPPSALQDLGVTGPSGANYYSQNATMFFGLRYPAGPSGTLYQAPLIPVPNDDKVGSEYNMSSYGNISDMVQSAIDVAVEKVNIANPATIPSDSIFFYFDPSESKFKINVLDSIYYNNGSPDVEIFSNQNLFNKIFSGFDCLTENKVKFTENLTANNNDIGHKLKTYYLPWKRVGGAPNFVEDGVSGTYMNISQEYPTISNLTSQMGIRVTSNITGVNAESFVNPLSWAGNVIGQSSSSSQTRIESLIGDFFIDYENAGDPRGKAIYYPTATLQWHDLNNFGALNKVDANLTWIDKVAGSNPFRPAVGQMFAIKYVFRKKQKYLTQRTHEIHEKLRN